MQLSFALSLTAFVIMLILAVYWEIKDNGRLVKRQNIYEICNEKEKVKEYEFYGTFNYYNNIQWRMIFVSTTIAVAVIYIAFCNQLKNISWTFYMYVFLIIFLVFYMSNHFKTFHTYRIMANKVKKNDIVIL